MIAHTDSCGLETNIQLSVVSAHKLVELYRLFDAAGGDFQASHNKNNYASKPQHLVLLNGFTLQERALSPSLVGYPPVTSVATPPAAMGTQVPPQGVTVPSVAGPGPSPNPLGPVAATPSPGPVSVGSPAPPQAGQAQMVRAGSVTQVVVHPTPNTQPMNIPNQQPVPLVRGPMAGMPRMIAQPRQRWPGGKIC
ncbi:mediator of RNA polymerase II transcription subunit 25-like [Homarus americanus]|uniref:mediator of RNA polymerase II transcription subunit 25-like n=1 Tax=Homarus americanus TaxID=6706 RepID=UPI001C4502A8|nr:mediator of RNA polymerase II transcription subunit 25-like [Homarus americanus]